MTERTRDTVVDAITLAVGLWFLLGPAFRDLRSPVADAAALLVMAYAVVRLARRWWPR